MSAILKFEFKKRITFLRRKSSKPHKKDTILHVTITFPVRQGQTRTSSGPITLPLINLLTFITMKLSCCYCLPRRKLSFAGIDTTIIVIYIIKRQHTIPVAILCTPNTLVWTGVYVHYCIVVKPGYFW